MPRTFSFKNVTLSLPTSDEAYANGFQTGANWRDNYRPGGPWVCRRPTLCQDAEWLRYCEATTENNTAWLRGFDAARAA